MPPTFPRSAAVELDGLNAELGAASPATIAAIEVPNTDRLSAPHAKYQSLRQQMIGLQEQLDWETYRLYGLIDEALTLPDGEPPIRLGERAFEIVLARQMAAGTIDDEVVRSAWIDADYGVAS